MYDKQHKFKGDHICVIKLKVTYFMTEMPEMKQKSGDLDGGKF